MIPTHLIPRLSPTAAKLYLIFADLPHRPFNGKSAASLHELCPLTRISRRSCFRALAELRTFNLVRILPRHVRLPAAYTLTQPAPAVPPVALQTSLRMPPVAPRTPITPIPSPESPKVPTMAPQQTLAQQVTRDPLLDPAAIRQCLAAASPALRAQMLHAARQALTRPDATPEARATARAALAAASQDPDTPTLRYPDTDPHPRQETLP